MTDISKRSRGALLLTSMCLAVLTACGGGDDPVVAAEPAPVVTPAVAVVTMPAAGTSAGVSFTGDMNYGVFSPVEVDPYRYRFVPADVTNDGLDGTLTLNALLVAPASVRAVPAAVVDDGSVVTPILQESFVVSTANAWLAATWPVGADGVLALNGNAALFCNTEDDSGQVGISGNLTQVLDLADLRGKSFQYKTCANGAVENDGGITFNQDGSAVFVGDGESTIHGANFVAEYFSKEGWSIDGGVFYARAFYRDVAGTREYVIVDISRDPLNVPQINTVALLVEFPK